MQDKKLRVAVIYGGRSAEHQVSLASAKSVLTHLDQQKYEVIPIAIDRQGHWLSQPFPSLLEMPVEQWSMRIAASTSLPRQAASLQRKAFDVVFPVLHGSLGEDGTLQGLLELADLPYVGCGVLASALCMDKDIAKRLVQQVGIPVTPYRVVRAAAPLKLAELSAELAQQFHYPLFVKPANTGSSVGISKIATPSELEAALSTAFSHDEKVLIEQGIAAREIEIAVLESLSESVPLVSSVAGEIINAEGEFYTYQAKYSEASQAKLQVPASLSEAALTTLQDYARTIFTTLECRGMARVDFFIDQHNGNIYFNELNTIPGFTTISLYPRLWEASGLSYQALLTQLIELALKNKTVLSRCGG